MGTLTLAACTLHNYLLANNQIGLNTIADQDDNMVANGIGNLAVVPRPHSRGAREIRDAYREYVNNEGAVDWQENMI